MFSGLSEDRMSKIEGIIGRAEHRAETKTTGSYRFKYLYQTQYKTCSCLG